MRSETTGTGRGVWIGAVLAIAATGALDGCPEQQGDAAQELIEESVELPPMSEGTLQALGPHVFVAETRLEPGEGSDRVARVERIELRWQDRQHYHLRRWVDGDRRRQEIREENWVLVRKGGGPFLPVPPDPGPAVLRDTMVPGNRMFGEVELAALIQETPRDGDEGPRGFTFVLRPELVVGDEVARAELERRYAESGATMLPVSVEGEVVTDELGNRTRMRIVFGYRVASGPVYGPAVIEKIHEESREPAPAGVDLDLPAEAVVLFAEARAQRQAATDTPR